MIITGVFCLFGCHSNKTAVNDFERIDIRESGMRLTADYEIINLGSDTQISLYYLNYSSGEEKRELEKQTLVDTETFTEKLNEFGLASWDGFHGKHPKHVSDGIMFSLTAKINGDTVIKADGSENFPKNYRDFMRYINGLLKQSETNPNR